MEWRHVGLALIALITLAATAAYGAEVHLNATAVSESGSSPAKGDSQAAETFINGTRFLWFARGVGVVRMRYEHSDGKATEVMRVSHSLVGRGDTYLPLQVGNQWTYAWKNDYRQEAVIETWKLGDRPDDPASLPTRSGSGNTPEIKVVDPNSVTLDLSQATWIKVAADSK